MRYSVGDWHSTATPCSAATASRSAGSKRASCSRRGGAHRPRRDERVAGRLRPAAGRGAPRQLAGARAEPVLGLRRLAAQVALRVHDRRAGSPAVPGREDQERGVLGARCRPARRAASAWGRPSASTSMAPRRLLDAGERVLQLRHVAPGGEHQSRPCLRDPQGDVLGAQLLGAGQGDGAQPPRAEQREDPFRPGAHQRHHDVAAADSRAAPGRPPPPRPRPPPARTSRSARTRPAAIARSASSDGPLAGEPLDHVAGEVEAVLVARARMLRAVETNFGCRRAGHVATLESGGVLWGCAGRGVQ